MAICIDKKNDTYYITYKIKLPDGSRKSRTIRNKERKVTGANKVSKRYLQRIQASVIAEDYHNLEKVSEIKPNKNPSLKEVATLYLDYIKRKKKWTTVYAQEIIVNKYIFKFFNPNKPIDESLTITSVSHFTNEVSKLKYTADTKNKINRALKEILSYASTREIIKYEYERKLTNLLENYKEYEVKEEIDNFWTDEEFDKFINSFKEDDPWKLFFEVTYYGALRIGEVLGLEFKDINYLNRTISINKTLDSRGNIATTKNASSNASVTLPTRIIEKLEAYQNKFHGNPDEFVFFIKHTSRTTARRILNEHIKISEVKKIKFHGLRHSMASRMINKGCNPLIVSKHLRHSSTQQTLDTYSHLFPNITNGIMDKI